MIARPLARASGYLLGYLACVLGMRLVASIEAELAAEPETARGVGVRRDLARVAGFVLGFLAFDLADSFGRHLAERRRRADVVAAALADLVLLDAELRGFDQPARPSCACSVCRAA